MCVFVCVLTAGLEQVTDVGMASFSAALKARTSITTVELGGTCDPCEYLYGVDVWKQDEEIVFMFMFCVCTAAMDNVTDVGWTTFSSAVKASTSVTTLDLDCTCDHCSQL